MPGRLRLRDWLTVHQVVIILNMVFDARPAAMFIEIIILSQLPLIFLSANSNGIKCEFVSVKCKSVKIDIANTTQLS